MVRCLSGMREILGPNNLGVNILCSPNPSHEIVGVKRVSVSEQVASMHENQTRKDQVRSE